MLFDLNCPCYLTTFSGKKCLSGKVICAFFLSRLSKFSCLRKFHPSFGSQAVEVALRHSHSRTDQEVGILRTQQHEFRDNLAKLQVGGPLQEPNGRRNRCGAQY
jgi:hypothetical protein